MTRRLSRVVLAATLAALIAAGCLPSGSRGGRGPGSPIEPAAATTPSPAPTGPTPLPTIVPPTPTPAPSFFVYTVATGDSLNTIAHRFKTTARSIAFWNRSTYPSLDPEGAHYRPDRLEVGWTLVLLPNETVDEQELPDPTDVAASDPGEVVATESEEP